MDARNNGVPVGWQSGGGAVGSQLIVLGALVALTVVLGLAWRARQGRVRTVPARSSGPGVPVVDWAARGVGLGERATFVQFSAEVCAPCRATARVLRDLAVREPGVRHHELDVEEHLDLVRERGALTPPTGRAGAPAGPPGAGRRGGGARAPAPPGRAAAAPSAATRS
jgi:thiol-disulfide isomerase/thioredoxin